MSERGPSACAGPAVSLHTRAKVKHSRSWTVPEPNTTVCVSKGEKSPFSPHKHSPPWQDLRGEGKGLSIPLAACRLKNASGGKAFTPHEGVWSDIPKKSYLHAASMSSETQICSQGSLIEVESTNLIQLRSISINFSEGIWWGMILRKPDISHTTHTSGCLLYLWFVYPDNVFMQIINPHGNQVESSLTLLLCT